MRLFILEKLAQTTMQCHFSKEFCKDGLTRSLDLKLRPKNQIFDLDRLRVVESKKLEAKVEETIKSETL